MYWRKFTKPFFYFSFGSSKWDIQYFVIVRQSLLRCFVIVLLYSRWDVVLKLPPTCPYCRRATFTGHHAKAKIIILSQAWNKILQVAWRQYIVIAGLHHRTRFVLSCFKLYIHFKSKFQIMRIPFPFMSKTDLCHARRRVPFSNSCLYFLFEQVSFCNFNLFKFKVLYVINENTLST